MSDEVLSKVKKTLAITYAVFAVGSTFSIALAQMALAVSLALFLVCVISERYNPFSHGLRWFYILVAAYVGWMALASLAGPTPLRSLSSLREDWLFCAIPIGIYLLQSRNYRQRLVFAFGIAVGIMAVYAIIQFAFGLDVYHSEPLATAGEFGWRPRGNFEHRLTFGTYYVSAAMFLLGYATISSQALSSRWRHVLLIAAVLASVAVALTISRGVLLSLVVVLIAYAITRGRRYLAVVAGVLIVGMTLMATTLPILVDRFSDAINKETDPQFEGGRLFIWGNSLSMIGENPLFGVGIGNYGATYKSYLRADIEDSRKHSHAHNDILNIAANNGIPGGLLFTGMWVVALGLFWRGWRAGPNVSEEAARCFLAALLGSAAFFITSLTEATFADEEVRQMLMFVWAVGLWPLYNGHAGTATNRKTS